MATVVLMVLGLYVLGMLARPFTRYRTVLLLAMIGLFLGALAIPLARGLLHAQPPVAGERHSRAGGRDERVRGPGARDPCGPALERGHDDARYSQPFRLKRVHSRIVAIAMDPRAKKYPKCSLSSGMYLKFIP